MIQFDESETRKHERNIMWRWLLFLPMFILLSTITYFILTWYGSKISELDISIFIKFFLFYPLHILVFVLAIYLPVLISASFCPNILSAAKAIRFSLLILVGYLIYKYWGQTNFMNNEITTFMFVLGSLWATKKKYLIMLRAKQAAIKYNEH